MFKVGDVIEFRYQDFAYNKFYNGIYNRLTPDERNMLSGVISEAIKPAKAHEQIRYNVALRFPGAYVTGYQCHKMFFVRHLTDEEKLTHWAIKIRESIYARV